MMDIDIVELVQQTNGEFEDKYELSHLKLVSTLPNEVIIIEADGRRLWRVLENLYNNACKYAMENTRVYVGVEDIDNHAVFSIKNISASPLNISPEELTERFVRGDVSRTTEGSGLGLSIVASAFSGLSQKCYVSEPSYCCLHKRLDLGSGVFGAAKDYLRRYPEYTDAALETLTYFDINNIVSCLKVPTDFCLALADPICLPEFVYSAYAHVDAPKQIHIYPFVPHYTPEDYDYFVHSEFSKL